MTRALVSRTNDTTREPARPSPLNQERIRYVLHAFYLEANLHSEVYSLFEALLNRLTKWAGEESSKNGGFSMNSMHEMMTLCRRAADELQVIRDYRQRAGTGTVKNEPLGLVAVLPAVMATLGVPQRTEIIAKIVTIAPEHRELIMQFAEHVRIFCGKPWKEPSQKAFKPAKEGPLRRSINGIIREAGRGDVRCTEREHVGEVDRIIPGLIAGLRAAMFVGQCGKHVKSTFAVERFAQKASAIVVPKVVLESSRPLSAVRFELFQYASLVPSRARSLLQIVTRAVNEKMELRDIAERVSQAVAPTDILLAPVVLAPLALVSSLRQVLNLADIVIPSAPDAFRLVTATMFAAIQGGDDYYKLAEQIDHDQAMYRAPRSGGLSKTIAINLTAFYKRTDVGRLEAAEREYADQVASALQKGFKALAWNRRVPQRLKNVALNCLAREARSFSQVDPEPTHKHIVDYWHALSRYILAARIPFQQPHTASMGNLAGEYRSKLAVQDYGLLAAWKAMEGGFQLDRIDQLLAYENYKLALLCADPRCSIDAGRAGFPVVMELLQREADGADRGQLLGLMLQQPDLLAIIQSRLARPSLTQQPADSFNNIASRLRGCERHNYPVNQLIEDALQATRLASPEDYLKAAVALLHDRLSHTLNVHIHLPAAVLMTFIHGSQSVRQRLLVAMALERPILGQIGVRDVCLANHLQHRLYPPAYAVEYVRGRLEAGMSREAAGRIVSIEGVSGQSRFGQKLKEAIVEEATRRYQWSGH